MSITTHRKLANAVVIINWILFAIYVLTYVLGIIVCLVFFDAVAKLLTEAVQEATKDDEEKLSDEDILKGARLVMTIALVIFGIVGIIAILIQMALNILVMRGVNQSDRRRCNIWLVINLIFFIFAVLGLIGTIFKVINGTTHWAFFPVDLFGVIWLGASLIIIKNYRDDLGTSASYGGVVYSKADSNPAV